MIRHAGASRHDVLFSLRTLREINPGQAMATGCLAREEVLPRMLHRILADIGQPVLQ